MNIDIDLYNYLHAGFADLSLSRPLHGYPPGALDLDKLITLTVGRIIFLLIISASNLATVISANTEAA